MILLSHVVAADHRCLCCLSFCASFCGAAWLHDDDDEHGHDCNHGRARDGHDDGGRDGDVGDGGDGHWSPLPDAQPAEHLNSDRPTLSPSDRYAGY